MQNAAFGSADPIAFAFALAALILGSITLIGQIAEATRQGAILSIIRGMRLVFVPDAVDALHIHEDVWANSLTQDFVITHSGLVKLMLRHPCAWKACPAIHQANLSGFDYINLACIDVLNDYNSGATKLLFVIKWSLSALAALYAWLVRDLHHLQEAEFNELLDKWLIKTVASSSDPLEEEMRFLEKLACLRMLRWNRSVGSDEQTTAWEVPKQRKYTMMWLLLSLKNIVGNIDEESHYDNVGNTGTWASIERIGMTWHVRTGERRLGIWTTYRIWKLEERRWRNATECAEMMKNPELRCQNRLTSQTPDFGNYISMDSNALFFMQTDRSLVTNLFDLIASLKKNNQQTSIQEHQLASAADMNQLETRGEKAWCRCMSGLRAMPDYLCCVPICTLFLKPEAAGSIIHLPGRASGEIIYIMRPKGESLLPQQMSTDAPVVKQGDKDIFACMLAFKGMAIIATAPSTQVSNIPPVKR